MKPKVGALVHMAEHKLERPHSAVSKEDAGALCECPLLGMNFYQGAGDSGGFRCCLQRSLRALRPSRFEGNLDEAGEHRPCCIARFGQSLLQLRTEEFANPVSVRLPQPVIGRVVFPSMKAGA